jgi:sec-independent protein translocase protein TatC
MAASKRAAKSRTATTFHDHLKELRWRAFIVVAVFVVASSVAYNYKDWLLTILMRPLGGEKLIYLTPAGGFSFIFQVTVYAGLIVTIPVLIYNIFRFIAPVLSRETRLYSATVVASSILLLAAGVSFGYFYAIPAAMQFLVHFADGFANASLTAESYLGFVMAYTAGLGLLFQLPLLLLFIHWIYPLKPKKLLSFERYMVLIAFVVAAVISPTPDALNQTIIAAPIILMYQIGVIAVWLSVHRKKKKVILAATNRAQAQQLPAISPAPVQSRPPVRTTGGLRRPVVPPQRPAVRSSAKAVVGVMRSRSPSIRSIDGLSIISKGLDDSIF